MSTEDRITDLDAVAEGAVLARHVAGRIVTDVGDLVASVGGAANAVVAVHRSTGLTVERGVTGLCAVAELTVIAETVRGRVETGIGHGIAAVDRTRDAVIASRARASLAVRQNVAGLRAVAQHAVVTQAVLRRMITGIGGVVAAVDRAADTIVTIDHRTRLTIKGKVAHLRPIAE